jgi:hypothetical protein
MKTEKRSPPRGSTAAAPYGYKSESGPSRQNSSGGALDTSGAAAVKAEPRDIDMRKARQQREIESYSPTRPDYTPTTTVKTEGNIKRLNPYLR